MAVEIACSKTAASWENGRHALETEKAVILYWWEGESRDDVLSRQAGIHVHRHVTLCCLSPPRCFEASGEFAHVEPCLLGADWSAAVPPGGAAVARGEEGAVRGVYTLILKAPNLQADHSDNLMKMSAGKPPRSPGQKVACLPPAHTRSWGPLQL